MNKKIVISLILVAIVIVVVSIVIVSNENNLTISNTEITNNPREEGSLQNNIEEELENLNVKEFTMESYTDIVNGQFFPSFSLKEINVNKGDLVRIKITTTSGTHDFKIDEFNVYADTPLNKEVVVEFVADKTGEFVYYCAKPNHRELGHWGTLIVSE